MQHFFKKVLQFDTKCAIIIVSKGQVYKKKKENEVKKMTKCYIDFAKEVCEGLIGTKECVKAFLTSLNGEYDYEGNQRVRNRAEHKWEWVVVYSFATYYGTRFVCYKAE